VRTPVLAGSPRARPTPAQRERRRAEHLRQHPAMFAVGYVSILTPQGHGVIHQGTLRHAFHRGDVLSPLSEGDHVMFKLDARRAVQVRRIRVTFTTHASGPWTRRRDAAFLVRALKGSLR